MAIDFARRLPVGAEVLERAVQFRVWAPQCRQVDVVFLSSRPALQLERRDDGYFEGSADAIDEPLDYYLRLDNQPGLLPDPASRFQPRGPSGPSRVVDPCGYAWHDAAWPGVDRTGQVLYEMHLGTFTPQGTWLNAQAELPALADLGVTVLEVMPIAEFHGDFGWSYDGANLFAPSHLYGQPDDVRRFIDEAHRLGLGVLLDVVYNHWSSLGERLLRPFAAQYVSKRHQSEWGASPNFDGEGAGPVREFFLANARYWIEEFHFDGLRVDATQSFFDESPNHVLAELVNESRAAAGNRHVLIIGENEPQTASLMRPQHQRGFGFDAMWNDDFHHTAGVRLTGSRQAYYNDYLGTADELLATVRWGYLFQGQRYEWQDNPRGTPALDRPAEQFVNFLENHDQLANSLTGERLHQRSSPGCYRAMTALWLLAPQTPLLFQGQEFAATTPFLYFNDAPPTEADSVRKGRAEFLRQFPSLSSPEIQLLLPDPCDPASFRRSKLDPRERREHAQSLALHRDLLRLRREDPVLRWHDATRIHGVRLSDDALMLRYLGSSDSLTRLLIVNFGRELRLSSISNPLVAPPEEARWTILWSSDETCYGGGGASEPETATGWRITAESAALLQATETPSP